MPTRTCQVDSRDQEQIGDIEDEPADERRNDVAPVGDGHVGEKSLAATAGRAQGERQDERDQKDADGIVPVEEFEPVVLRHLAGVGPRTPANGARNHHHHGHGESLWNEHATPLSSELAGTVFARV